MLDSRDLASYIKARRGLPDDTTTQSSNHALDATPPAAATIVTRINTTSRQAARRVSSIEGLKLGKILLYVALFACTSSKTTSVLFPLNPSPSWWALPGSRPVSGDVSPAATMSLRRRRKEAEGRRQKATGAGGNG